MFRMIIRKNFKSKIIWFNLGKTLKSRSGDKQIRHYHFILFFATSCFSSLFLPSFPMSSMSRISTNVSLMFIAKQRVSLTHVYYGVDLPSEIATTVICHTSLTRITTIIGEFMLFSFPGGFVIKIENYFSGHLISCWRKKVQWCE